MKVIASTGTCSDRDSFLAGKKAAETAVAGLAGKKPGLIIVYTTPSHDLAALIGGVRSVTNGTPLAGATTAGEIVEGSRMGFGAGVAVLAMTAGPYSFGIASASHIRGNLAESGEKIARESRTLAGESRHSALILFADALAGDLQQLFHGAYRVCGPMTTIVGGAASDELKFKACFSFHDDKVIEEGAVGVWVNSPRPLRVVTKHGWSPVGVPLLVTKAEGTEIFELGGQPAADAYEEQLGFAKGALSPDIFWNTSINHPFGILQMDGSSVIRVARRRTETGSLIIQACVPPVGSAIQVMEGTRDSLLAITESVARESLEGNPDAGVLLAFDCAMRATLFGDKADEEAKILKVASGKTTVFGAYCCGEFARTAGILGTHNATLTAIAL